MKAREPDADGFVEPGGVKIHYEVYGDGGGPTDSCCCRPGRSSTSEFWKLQVPYLARHHRVVTYDGPGNGRSDRPLDPAAYDHDRQVAYALAVLDATGTDRAVLVGPVLGCATGRSTWPPTTRPGARHGPDRAVRAARHGQHRTVAPSDGRPCHRCRRPGCRSVGSDPLEHWAKYNPDYWRSGVRRLPVVLLRAVLPRAAFDQADRGLRRLGPGDLGRGAGRRARVRRPGRRRPSRTWCAGITTPLSWPSTATTT